MSNLKATVEFLSRCECPFVFCDLNVEMSNSRYWEKLRYTLMELNVHSEICDERKDLALEVSCRVFCIVFRNCFVLYGKTVPWIGSVDFEAAAYGRNVFRTDL